MGTLVKVLNSFCLPSNLLLSSFSSPILASVLELDIQRGSQLGIVECAVYSGPVNADAVMLAEADETSLPKLEARLLGQLHGALDLLPADLVAARLLELEIQGE